MEALVIALVVWHIFYAIARAFGCTVNILVDRWIKSSTIKAMLGVVPEHVLTGRSADEPKLTADPEDHQRRLGGQ
jgi:hypothetical protein